MSRHPAPVTPGAIRRELFRVERDFQKLLRTENRLLSRLRRWSAETPGKMLRPTLLLLASRIFGSLSAKVRAYAVAVETVHTASLVVDDLLDDPTHRRGRPSITATWGRRPAIVFGLFLYARAYDITVKQGEPEAVRIITETIDAMVAAEALEVRHRGDWGLDERTYRQIIEGKTASLFAGACQLASLGTKPSARHRGWTTFGRNVGMAYQLRDDAFDVEEDVRQGVPTLPSLRVFSRLSSKRSLSDDQAKQSILTSPDLPLMRASARAEAKQYASRALRFLASLPASPGRDDLTAFVREVLG